MLWAFAKLGLYFLFMTEKQTALNIKEIEWSFEDPFIFDQNFKFYQVFGINVFFVII